MKGSCERAVEGANGKNVILTFFQDILHIFFHDQRMQFPKQALHLFHLPIIKVS